MDFTCVEIKNVKYIKLVPLDKKCERELDLTTIHKDQEQAFLNIFLIDKNKKKTLLKSIEVTNIRPGKSGIPELHLSVSYDGKQYYKILLKLNGFIYHNSVLDIKHLRNATFRFSNILLIALALMILSFLAFFSFKTINNNFERRTLRTQVVKDESINQEKSQPEETKVDNLPSESNQIETSQPEVLQPDEIVTEMVESDEITLVETTEPEVTQIEVSPAEYDQSEPHTIEISELIDNHAIVYFYPNSSVLTSDAKSILIQIMDILSKNKNLDVEILGHCAYYGTEKGRQEISTERAENVYSYFIANGWTPESKPLIVGLGLKKIVTRDPQKQNLNRRVEINIKSKKEDS